MDHSMVFTDPVADVHEVTDTCLVCHADVAESFMLTSHWTWVTDEVVFPGEKHPSPFGKINSINNFCVSVPGNWERCSQCHAGYGWKDKSFDFTNPSNIDCLVCHDRTGMYKKDLNTAGYPPEGLDLLAIAQSVGMPTRANCGACHFNGGGGNGAKHGDLDMSLIECSEDIDVHMGLHDFSCQDCHWTEEHEISGRLPWMTSDTSKSFACSSCHGEHPHEVERLNDHCSSVACQTCHIPDYAREEQTVLEWDWSAAGLDEAPDGRAWDKKKGSFIHGNNVTPDYLWWNGDMQRYLPGQSVDSQMPVQLNLPLGGIEQEAALIWPFKINHGKQPFDAKLNHILVPKLSGEGGFWETWDWQAALELGAEQSGVEFSGEFVFAESEMHWPITHMVPPAAKALRCMDCHGEDGRMPWSELGYGGDPMFEGGR